MSSSIEEFIIPARRTRMEYDGTVVHIDDHCYNKLVLQQLRRNPSDS